MRRIKGIATPVEQRVLAILLQTPIARFGLEIVALGRGTIARGSIHRVLREMERFGYVTAKAEENPARRNSPRIFYTPTTAGYAAYLAASAQDEI